MLYIVCIFNNNARRPDLVVVDKHLGNVMLIDVAIPSDLNVADKEAEKINKYQDLRIELEWLWKMRTSMVPVINGALGCVSHNFSKHLSSLSMPTVDKFVLQNLLYLHGSVKIMRHVLQLSESGLVPELD